jgi:hypothetical protein
MRYLRSVLIAAVAVGALVVPSSASAQINSLAVSSPVHLTADRSVVVVLTFECDPGFIVASGDVTVRQVTGFKQAVGIGSFFDFFDGVPCTGALQTREVTASSFGSFALKPGKAVATTNLTVFDPTTFTVDSESTALVEIRVRR